MRKAIIALAIIVAASSFVHAEDFVMFKKKAAAGYTLITESTVDNDGVYQIGQATGNYYRGAFIKFVGAHSITKVTAKLAATGDVSGKSYTMRIWTLTSQTQSAASLDVQQGASTPVTGVTGTAIHDFIFSTPVSLADNTYYGFTLDTGEAVDASNYASFKGTTGGGTVSTMGWCRWGSDKVITLSSADELYMSYYE